MASSRDVSARRRLEERDRALVDEQAARECAEAAAARFRFLAEAGTILGSSLDIERTLRSLTRLTVPRIADWCSLDLVEPHGGLRRVEVAHSDPERERFAHEVYRLYPADPTVRNEAAQALRKGEPVFVPDFDERMLAATARDERHLALLRSFGFRSVMVVPMTARDRLVGLVTLATAESQRRFSREDVELVCALASRAALALENARLFEKTRATAHAREEAVATVAHDLRNPLSVAILNASMLRQTELPPEERTRALERVDRALAGMRRMIESLLDVARMEAGAIQLDLRTTPVAAILADACELVQPAAALRSVSLEHEADERLRVRADRDRSIQVLANLIDNAVRHSPERGRVRVSARAVDERTLFCVEDQGSGVPEELRDRIFERFWQREGGPRQGAGLGLAIARGLVELHGGRIWVDSSETGGARFQFTLESDRDAGS